MKRFLFAAQVILLAFFCISFCATVLQVSGTGNPLVKFNYENPVYNYKEEYDPALARLNSIKKLEQYCDSLYASGQTNTLTGEFDKTYTDVVSAVIRKRFYHGYSHYGFDNNYFATLTSKLTLDGYSAIVIPDDILDYPFAACSQQAIVMMEVLKKKGLRTRKIAFQGKFAGHFSFEVFYKGSWHFYDTNLEPDINVLNRYNRPGIAFLADHPAILLQAYRHLPSQEVLDVFPTYRYGAVNKFPAPRAIVFQKASRLISYTLWFFFLTGFFIVRRQYRRITRKNYVRNRRIYFPQPQAGTSSSYYPGITAPGS